MLQVQITLLGLLTGIIAVYSLEAPPFLLFANRKDIRIFKLNDGSSASGGARGGGHRHLATNNATVSVIGQLEDAAALDFYFAEELIFWSDAGTEMIKRMRLPSVATSGGGKNSYTNVISSGLISPDGLACDWLGKKLYWTDSETNRVEVSNLDGSHRKVLFWKDLDQPRAIALVPNEGLIFWTDWGETPKIERAGMDGDHSTRKVIVKTSISWPNGLTIDYDTKRVYWADAKLKFISSIDFDGNHRAIVVSGNLPHPFALTLYGDMLYWTDWTTKSIHSCNKKDGTQRKTIVGGNLSPMDIHAYAKDRQPTGKTKCSDKNGGCSHLCLMSPNKDGFYCACPTGVRLLNDNKTCADGAQEILLLARKTDIRLISLDTPDYTDVVLQLKGIKHAIAIDFDPVDNRIYWTDDEARVIRTAFLNGTGQTDLLTTEIQLPDGIAIDWVARNLYWTDTGTDRIEVARLNGQSRRILITDGLNEPRAIIVEPEFGYLYWTDWGAKPKIERAALDGSEREAIVMDNLGWPNGLAIDYETRKLYWGDAQTDSIEMCDVNGKNRKILVKGQLPHVFGFTLLGDFVYWTDWQRRSIERVNKKDGQNHEVIIDQLPDLMGLKASNILVKRGTNPCATNNGGCSHLCLNRPKNDYICACPMGLELTSDLRACIVPEAFLLFSRKTDIRRISLQSHHSDVIPLSGIEDASALDYDINDNRIYWTDSNKKSISRAFLNGSGIEAVVEFGLDFPQGLAVDWVARNLYWSDMGTNRIEVSRLDGSSRSVILWKGLENPRSLAIDPGECYIYWVEWGNRYRIERAGLDGSHRSIIISNMGKASGLTIDYVDKRLYWMDMDNHALESSEFKGTSRRQILSDNVPKPYALTQYQDYIFWTDFSSKSIERANKIDGKNRTRILSNIEDVVDILVFHSSWQSGWNHCQVNNGGCSHLCLALPNEAGAKNFFRCGCPTHYVLDTDNRTCSPPKTFLLFSQKNSISRIVVGDPKGDSPDVNLPVHGLKNVKAIDYDPAEELVYWIDAKTHSIKRSYDNGTKISTLVSSVSLESLHPYDMALDPYSRVIYWTCALHNVINVTRLDGRPVGVVVSGDNQTPRSIALHPLKGLLFWTNMIHPPRIERSLMNGLQRKVLVETLLDNPVALAVDPMSDFLFWADIGSRRIESVQIDGSKRVTVLANSFMQPIALTANSGFMYWADKEQQSIEKANYTGGDITRILVRLPYLSDVVMVDDRSKKVRSYTDHPCFSHNGGCSHICAIHEDGKKHCSCPLGLTLSKEDKMCISPPTCSSDQFSCAGGSVPCIPMVWRCDKNPECEDGSDEQNCPTCKPEQFRCMNGECINHKHMCEGSVFCSDGSEICCKEDEFLCPATKECIKMIAVCDGVQNCADGYDEKRKNCDNAAGLKNEEANKHQDHSTYAVGTVIAILSLIGIAVVGFMCKRKTHSPIDNEESVDMMVANSIHSSRNYKEHSSRKNVCIMPPSNGSISFTLPRSSFYDRNHVTGASSSSSGGTPFPQTLNPPPSPVTSQYTYSHYCPSHVAPSTSMRSYRNYRSRNRPPPPTPCSTDVCDDSEPNYPLRSRYYLSSQTEFSYDSDPNHPPPPTPRSQYLSDDNGESYPPSPSTERSFCKPYPPPPSPAPLSDY